MLVAGASLSVAGREAAIVRRAGTEQRPIVRVEGVGDRAAAEALRGAELSVARRQRRLLSDGEWWSHELEGCTVTDGDLVVGAVLRMIELPSCEALEVIREGASQPLLMPMVKDAVRRVERRRAAHRRQHRVPRTGAGEAGAGARAGRVEDRRLHPLPELVEWFSRPAPRRNALAAGSRLEFLDIRAHTPLSAGQVDDTPFGGGAGMLLRVDVLDSALRAHYGEDPAQPSPRAA